MTSLPGAAACITALTMSGLPTRRFAFEAFLPRDKKERALVLNGLANETRTIIIYEAPHHLVKTLEELESVLGNDRKLTICRELTKRYEEKMQTTLSDPVSAIMSKTNHAASMSLFCRERALRRLPRKRRKTGNP